MTSRLMSLGDPPVSVRGEKKEEKRPAGSLRVLLGFLAAGLAGLAQLGWFGWGGCWPFLIFLSKTFSLFFKTAKHTQLLN